MIIEHEEHSTSQPVARRKLPDTSLAVLPNEILLVVLHYFATPALLPLIRINQRFGRLIINILYTRLLLSSQLGGNRSVQLECYRPLDRLSAETLLCSSLGTDDLTPPDPKESVLNQLRNYNGCFTRFRPYRNGTTGIRPWRHPAGDVPGSRTYQDQEHKQQAFTDSNAPSTSHASSSSTNGPANSSRSTSDSLMTANSSFPTQPDETIHPYNEEDFDPETLPPVKQPINLDAHEVFTQLQTTTSLVTAGPKSGFIYSAVTASDGVIRVFRHWLASQDERRRRQKLPPSDTVVPLDDPSILWVNDTHRNVGVRFTVHEKELRIAQPILVGADEEVAVHYEVQIEEIMVRTRHLLRVTEQADKERKEAVGGSAIVLGNW